MAITKHRPWTDQDRKEMKELGRLMGQSRISYAEYHERLSYYYQES